MKDQWELKWLREGAFIPFGSMCNSYAQIHQGKNKTTNKLTIEQFLSDMDKIFAKSNEMIRQNNEEVSEMKEDGEMIIEEQI